MNVLSHTVYPSNQVKAAIQVFDSPGVPKRPDFAKELGSIVYIDHTGTHVVYLLEVPDAKVGEFLIAQRKRSTYFASRIEGWRIEIQTGPNLMEGRAEGLPLLP